MAIVSPEVRLKDNVVATTWSFLSGVASHLPEAIDFTIDHQAPSAIRARWYNARYFDLPGLKPAQWLTFERDEAAGFLPKNFPLSGILHIDRQRMDYFRREYGEMAMPTVAYKLGTATVAGYSQKYQILGSNHEDYYEVAMGIGKGALIAGAGVTLKMNGRHLYLPLSEGLSPGPILSKPEIPEVVPSV